MSSKINVYADEKNGNLNIANSRSLKINTFIDFEDTNHQLFLGNEILASNNGECNTNFIPSYKLNCDLKLNFDGIDLTAFEDLSSLDLSKDDNLNIHITDNPYSFFSKGYNELMLKGRYSFNQYIENSKIINSEEEEQITRQEIAVYAVPKTVTFMGETFDLPVNEITEGKDIDFNKSSSAFQKWLMIAIINHWQLDGTNTIPLMKDAGKVVGTHVIIPLLLKFSKISEELNRKYILHYIGGNAVLFEKSTLKITSPPSPSANPMTKLSGVRRNATFALEYLMTGKRPEVSTAFIDTTPVSKWKMVQGTLIGASINLFLIGSVQMHQMRNDPTQNFLLSKYLAKQVENIISLGASIGASSLTSLILRFFITVGKPIKSPKKLIAFGISCAAFTIGVIAGLGMDELFKDKKIYNFFVKLLEPVDKLYPHGPRYQEDLEECSLKQRFSGRTDNPLRQFSKCMVNKGWGVPE